ncbi:MAG: DUF1761 domain-containing protein [Bacteroidota bacterium]|nr:DUF1761 domain-containing protein [Bacteroidota bacterium]MDE2832988.1 DUF1761 domain-containing protein [Bacteroidota bacterium]MDE2957736.1 DUF1761 domain-containing protein [Bacteroidota bacterium]
MFDINWLAVVVAAVIPMLLGSLWYGPLFGKLWMSMIGMTEAEIREDFNALKSYGGSTVGAVLTAFVLAVLMSESGTVSSALTLAGLCWLGFHVPFGWQSVAFEDRALGLYALNLAYNLVTLIVMVLVIAVWP